jgi:hypothetical protein
MPDINIIKNFALRIKTNFSRPETIVETAERKAQEDAQQYESKLKIELFSKLEDEDKNAEDNLEKHIILIKEKVEKFRKQRFDDYFNLLNKQSNQKSPQQRGM